MLRTSCWFGKSFDSDVTICNFPPKILLSEVICIIEVLTHFDEQHHARLSIGDGVHLTLRFGSMQLAGTENFRTSR